LARRQRWPLPPRRAILVRLSRLSTSERAIKKHARRIRTRAVFAALAYLAASVSFSQSADLPNRHDALEGITTAGQPSEAGLAAIAAADYKSVIDLRGVNEDRGFDERQVVEMLGMSYVNLPVEGAAGVSYANAGALDKLLGELPKPVLVHCSTGNRVGALLALRAKANGADARSALELGVANGLAGLKPVVEEKLNAGYD
jgi:protein tyrosine phosphatase (PTP) superfamily phosphohydrolase (DUF442 family)